MNEKTILFIPSNANHVQIFLPLYKILKDRYKVLFLTQGSYKNEGADQALNESKVSFKKIDDYKKREPKSILQQENVGVVVIGNDIDVIPQWFVNNANKLGIATVLVQDGILFEYKTLHQGLPKPLFGRKSSNMKLKKLAGRLILSKQYKKITYGMGGCSKIFVWGKASESYLINRKVERNRIVITGNVRASEIKRSTKYENATTKKILYAPSDLVFSDIIKPKDLEKLIESVCSTIQSLESTKLVIKPHPREDMKFYEACRKYDSKIEISNDDVYDLLIKSDLVITDLSSFALEAMTANKPVIIFLPNLEDVVGSEYFPHDLVIKNAVFYAKDKQILFDQASMILDGKLSVPKQSVVKAVEEYLGPRDGMESSRVADSIIKLLNC